MSDSSENRPVRSGGLYPYRDAYPVYDRLPEAGVAKADIVAMVDAMASWEDEPYHEGKISGSIYMGDEEHYAFLTEVFGRFAHANVLQRDMYPSATKFEGEIIAMTAAMLNGGPETAGVLTFGGTESLMNPLLAYRERGRLEKGITEPQVIMPVTAHPAFDKGAHYFGIELLLAPLGPDHRVDVDWVADHITDRTVALIGSAGNYPHGLIDPIPELGQLALQHDLGLHVDGCLGGFILPWGRPLGYDVPPFDLGVPGVTSISADTHKYGYALKGSSVLLYRDAALRRYQYFMKTDWPGGLYTSPGMSGSRSGGIVAATWASMVALGREGYLRIAKGIFETAEAIKRGVVGIPQVQVVGDPFFCIAFTSDAVDIFHVNDAMVARGWRLNGLQRPPGFHFCVTRPNTASGVAERFVEDLRASVAYAENPDRPTPKSGAMYGAGGTPPPADLVAAGMASYLDATQSLPR
ncbi:MAG TPA: aminotransferase class V-fold PLP-dependent enzyme [Acidimicrobiales bacterium]